MWRQYPYIFSTFYRWKKQNKNSRPQGLFDIPLLLAWYLSFALPFLGTSKSTPEMIPIIHSWNLSSMIYNWERKEKNLHLTTLWGVWVVIYLWKSTLEYLITVQFSTELFHSHLSIQIDMKSLGLVIHHHCNIKLSLFASHTDQGF